MAANDAAGESWIAADDEDEEAYKIDAVAALPQDATARDDHDGDDECEDGIYDRATESEPAGNSHAATRGAIWTPEENAVLTALIADADASGTSRNAALRAAADKCTIPGRSFPALKMHTRQLVDIKLIPQLACPFAAARSLETPADVEIAVNAADSGVYRGAWTAEEDGALIEALLKSDARGDSRAHTYAALHASVLSRRTVYAMKQHAQKLVQNGLLRRSTSLHSIFDDRVAPLSDGASVDHIGEDEEAPFAAAAAAAAAAVHDDWDTPARYEPDDDDAHGRNSASAIPSSSWLWLAEEDEFLIARAQDGQAAGEPAGSIYSAIAAALPARTKKAVSNRFLRLVEAGRLTAMVPHSEVFALALTHPAERDAHAQPVAPDAARISAAQPSQRAAAPSTRTWQPVAAEPHSQPPLDPLRASMPAVAAAVPITVGLAWTAEEDSALIAKARVGETARSISSAMPGRTVSAVTNRLFRLVKSGKYCQGESTETHVPSPETSVVIDLANVVSDEDDSPVEYSEEEGSSSDCPGRRSVKPPPSYAKAAWTTDEDDMIVSHVTGSDATGTARKTAYNHLATVLRRSASAVNKRISHLIQMGRLRRCKPQSHPPQKQQQLGEAVAPGDAAVREYGSSTAVGESVWSDDDAVEEDGERDKPEALAAATAATGPWSATEDGILAAAIAADEAAGVRKGTAASAMERLPGRTIAAIRARIIRLQAKRALASRCGGVSVSNAGTASGQGQRVSVTTGEKRKRKSTCAAAGSRAVRFRVTQPLSDVICLDDDEGFSDVCNGDAAPSPNASPPANMAALAAISSGCTIEENPKANLPSDLPSHSVVLPAPGGLRLDSASFGGSVFV